MLCHKPFISAAKGIDKRDFIDYHKRQSSEKSAPECAHPRG
jgi:hypothetical protein